MQPSRGTPVPSNKRSLVAHSSMFWPLCALIFTLQGRFLKHMNSKYEKNQTKFGWFKPYHIFREEQCSNVQLGSLLLLPTCESVFFFDIWARSPCLWCFPHCPFCLLTEAKRTEPRLITLRSNNTGYCNWSLSENTEFFLAPRLPGTA